MNGKSERNVEKLLLVQLQLPTRRDTGRVQRVPLQGLSVQRCMSGERFVKAPFLSNFIKKYSVLRVAHSCRRSAGYIYIYALLAEWEREFCEGECLDLYTQFNTSLSR